MLPQTSVSVANAACQMLLDFGMPWHSFFEFRCRVVCVDAETGSFPEKLAAVLLQVPDKFPPFHARASSASMASFTCWDG